MKHVHIPTDKSKLKKACPYCKLPLMQQINRCEGCRERGVLLICNDCYKAWVWDWVTETWLELMEVKKDD